MLISLEKIATAAEQRGLIVHRAHGALEIGVTGESLRGHWHHGAIYSTADFNLNDRGGLMYGYNDAFHGPWHRGMTQASDFALGKLLAHPAMAGFDLAEARA